MPVLATCCLALPLQSNSCRPQMITAYSLASLMPSATGFLAKLCPRKLMQKQRVVAEVWVLSVMRMAW